MRKLADPAQLHDWESDHADADDLLCEVIRKLAQRSQDRAALEELVRLYEQVGKWYA